MLKAMTLIITSLLTSTVSIAAHVSILKDKEVFQGGTGGRIATVLIVDNIEGESEEMDRYWDYDFDIRYYKGENTEHIYTLEDTIIIQANQPNAGFRRTKRKVSFLRCYIPPKRDSNGVPTNDMFTRAMTFINREKEDISGFTFISSKTNASDCISFIIHSRAQAQVVTEEIPWSGPRIFLDPENNDDIYFGRISPSERSSVSVTMLNRDQKELVLSGTVGKESFHCRVKAKTDRYNIYNTYFNSRSGLKIFEVRADKNGECQNLKLYNSHWASFGG